MNHILITPNTHEDIDHQGRSLRDYSRLANARTAFEYGEAPSHWLDESKDLFYERKQKLEELGVEGFLRSLGYDLTVSEIIRFLRDKKL